MKFAFQFLTELLSSYLLLMQSSIRRCMGAGAFRGLQSRWALAEADAGGFDSLTPPPNTL